MSWYKRAQENDTGFLFDLCMKRAEQFPQYKKEWENRAQQVLNGQITDQYFAIWLNQTANSYLPYEKEKAQQIINLANTYQHELV